MKNERTTAAEMSITRPRMIDLLNEDLASALGIDVPPAKVPADRNGRHQVKDRHAARR